MELVTSTRQVPVRGPGNLVAIGKWDGVHLAHQQILAELVAEARRTGGQSVAVGFHPLPMAVLRPEVAPPMLQTLAERAEVMAAMGVDLHLALPFDPAFAALTPEDFVREVLVGQLRARQVMVGFNFTFGRGGQGTAETLRHLCEAHAIPVRIFDPVRVDGENVSSTEVRFNVAEGKMEAAARLLGRPFSIRGEVIHGDKRGRQIGFPTANIRLEEGRLLPANGVYAARVTLLGRPEELTLPRRITPRSGPAYGAMLNLGRRPTVGGTELRCEVHLFDFQGDLYGQELQVAFLHHLRSERPFPSLEALKAQLAADEQASREYLRAHG
ncbi:MAG: bifunctional riboflavin kinase/FAD synthetase [Bacillota bacterium]